MRYDSMVRDLFAEAAALRRWADTNLPELERMAPYIQAARLELLAVRLNATRQGMRGAVRRVAGWAYQRLRRPVA
jgi:hypothetical protein